MNITISTFFFAFATPTRPKPERHLPPTSPPTPSPPSSRKSPARGGCLMWRSERGMAGRCGDFPRTCHRNCPQNYLHDHIVWPVNFGLATLGDFVTLLGNFCGTDCVLHVGGCFVCHKVSTEKAVTSRDGTAQNVCNN